MRQYANTLYSHFLDRREYETPAQLIERFRVLFIQGEYYPDPVVQHALHQIISSPEAEDEFGYILNRCCHTLLNYWWISKRSDSEYRRATVNLISLFEEPFEDVPETSHQERLRSLITYFIKGQHYQNLLRRKWLVTGGGRNHFSEDQAVNHLVSRYYFMFPYYGGDFDSSEMGYQAVESLQKEVKDEYERALFNYTRCLLRSPTTPVLENPTLLTPEQTRQALLHFSGRAEGDRTYRDVARHFQARTSQVASFRDIKREVFGYLTDGMQYSLKPEYGNHRFNHWLDNRLEYALHQHDSVQPSPHLKVLTGAHLIRDLTCVPRLHPLSDVDYENHIRFVDMITNLGATFTVGLLLKILLMVSDIKSGIDKLRKHLEKQLTQMFKYYETKVQGEVKWLIECLENLLIALTVNFSGYDFSLIKHLK